MTKEWFIHIIKTYPKAYYRCLYHFRDHYPKEWKELMRDPDQLIEFFAGYRIPIKIDEEYYPQWEESKFKFTINGKFKLESRFEFKKITHAKWAGIEFAFMVMSFEIRQFEKKRIVSYSGVKRRRK